MKARMLAILAFSAQSAAFSFVSKTPKILPSTFRDEESIGQNFLAKQCTVLSSTSDSKSNDVLMNEGCRRQFLDVCRKTSLMPLAALFMPHVSWGATPTGSKDGNLPDLPPEAVRSYLQYRIPLQIAADYYVFSLQDMIGDLDEWGEVSQLFRVNNNKGQGQPSRMERDYINPMRVLLLSMPPDISEDMRTAQFKFEKAVDKVSKATAGYKRDLPVEVDAKSVTSAKEGWEEGRQALNQFFVLQNDATGLNEMKVIPESGPKQIAQYGRSPRKFNELTKKTKLCQNR